VLVNIKINVLLIVEACVSWVEAGLPCASYATIGVGSIDRVASEGSQGERRTVLCSRLFDDAGSIDVASAARLDFPLPVIFSVVVARLEDP